MTCARCAAAARGEVAITATDGPARLEVHKVDGDGLFVSLVDGVLEITHPDLTWGGLLSFVTHRGHRLGGALPRHAGERAAEIGVVSASAVVSGLTASTSVRSVSAT